MSYRLLDSGDGQKWEQFGAFVLKRPCPQAVWRPCGQVEEDASFSREEGNRWTYRKKLPPVWKMELQGVILKISPTDFGHVGVFPEHASLWHWMRRHIAPGTKVLNLFAYSGGATLAAALAGAEVCHLDASKGMVQWARENGELNHLSKAPIRWIVDDALKFLKREIKRQSYYDGIILDPPTFGRGNQGEVFKIERDIIPLLSLCREVLSKTPRFLIYSCHTPGFTSTVLSHLLGQAFTSPVQTGEMLLESEGAFSIPCGTYGRISYRTLAQEIV
ncbi:MAG: class I SAM-dependent methyltransferase [Chlamydiia bacterium]|nr:class I SAM-dependent methyltransferase [Chlamydiia bacterium]